jgi:hypothetical protein
MFRHCGDPLVDGVEAFYKRFVAGWHGGPANCLGDLPGEADQMELTEEERLLIHLLRQVHETGSGPSPPGRAARGFAIPRLNRRVKCGR